MAKAHRILDGVVAIRRCPAAVQPEEAKRRRVDAAPLFLRGRVERGEKLPRIWLFKELVGAWAKQPGDYEEEGEFMREELSGVLELVIEGMKTELMMELVKMMGP